MAALHIPEGKSPIVVVALGGNAIMSKGDTGSAKQQSQRIHEATAEIAKLVVSGCSVILTHGNGPQVGAIQKQQEIARDAVPPFPLDLCGAETQGWIGYVVQRELQNHLRRLGSDKEVVTLVTEIEVDFHDKAFSHPTKPIGAFLTKEAADLLVQEGKQVVEDSGRGYRQVVASPLPRAIVQQGVLATLTTYGNAVVIAAGGGGIPVITNDKGELEGVEAVIDKDETASLLARKMNADLLVICTDVPCAMINYRDPATRKEIHDTTYAEMSQHVTDGHFAAGSMLPKVLASLRFVETGKTAVITDLKSVGECMKLTHGTIIRPSPSP